MACYSGVLQPDGELNNYIIIPLTAKLFPTTGQLAEFCHVSLTICKIT